MKKMKRHFFTLALAICSICTSNAQDLKIGVHVGANVSNLSGGDTYRIYDSKYKVGPEIGADIAYTTKSDFTVSSGIGLLTGGIKRLLFRRRAIHGIFKSKYKTAVYPSADNCRIQHIPWQKYNT